MDFQLAVFSNCSGEVVNIQTNIYGVPLPFTMIYLLLFPYPSKTTFWVCSGILLFFMLLGYSGWTVRTLCIRLYSLLQGKQAEVA